MVGLFLKPVLSPLTQGRGWNPGPQVGMQEVPCTAGSTVTAPALGVLHTGPPVSEGGDPLGLVLPDVL